MFCFTKENVSQLFTHNIRISEFKRPPTPVMSAPPRKVLHLPKVRMLARGGRISSGIRITNVKTIKPPDPELLKQNEEDKLRSQVQKEIVSRSRTCAYAGYECWSPVLSGRRYCAGHILYDPNAPYVQCSHIYSSADRCPNAAPKDQRDGRDPQCFEHARAALMARQRSAAPPPPVASTETFLNQLQHYVKAERPRTTSCASSVSVVSDPAEPDQLSPIAVDPFKQMDAQAINQAHTLSILECCSASDSDGDSITLGPGGNCRHNVDASDTEDAPAEDTPLWRAGVFTAEEAVSETKNTLRSLQTAYIKQMERLKVLLQAARLQYLTTLKQEKEQYCSISSQARSGTASARERRQLRKLKAFAGYRRRHGTDAVLARKLLHRRAKANEPAVSRPVPPIARCTFSEGGVRCPAHSLPAAKHCLKHVLYDHHQVLFKACGDLRGLDACKEPVASLPVPSLACRYHTDPPQYTVFTLKKDDSDSDTETETAITDECSMNDEADYPFNHPISMARVNQTVSQIDPNLEQTIVGMAQNVDDMDQTIDVMAQNVDDMSQTIVDMDQTIDDMSQNANDMSQTIVGMDQTIDDMSQNANDIGQTIDDMVQNVDDMSQTIVGMDQTIDGMSQNADDMGQTIDDMSQNADDMAQNADNMGQTIESMDQSVDGIGHTLDSNYT